MQLPCNGVDMITLRTPRRMQKQPPARRGHFAVHARPNRTNISPHRKGNRKRQDPREPPGGIPGANETNWEQ